MFLSRKIKSEKSSFQKFEHFLSRVFGQSNGSHYIHVYKANYSAQIISSHKIF